MVDVRLYPYWRKEVVWLSCRWIAVDGKHKAETSTREDGSGREGLYGECAHAGHGRTGLEEVV